METRTKPRANASDSRLRAASKSVPGPEDTPLVSVIIPTFGRPGHVCRAIESVCAQTYSHVEIIVVDDNPRGSADQEMTEVALSSYIGRGLIRYVTRVANGGGSAARNTGTEAATGSLITFLDDDDVYLPEKISHQVHHIMTFGLDVSLCHMLLSENGAMVESPLCRARGTTLAEFILNGNTFTPMIMVRRPTLLTAGGFPDSPRFQDHLVMIKLFETGARTGILDEPLFIHNSHSEARISLAKQSLVGYKNKHAFELRNIGCLDEDQRKKLQFRQAVIGMKLACAEEGPVAGFRLLPAALVNLQTHKDLISIAKTIYNIVFRPGRHF